MVDALSGSTHVMFNGVSTAVCELHHCVDSVSGLQGALGGNKQKRTEADLITVEDIVKHHWQEFGRSAAQMVWAGLPLEQRICFSEAGLTVLCTTQLVLQQLWLASLCAVLCTRQAQVVLSIPLQELLHSL